MSGTAIQSRDSYRSESEAATTLNPLPREHQTSLPQSALTFTPVAFPNSTADPQTSPTLAHEIETIFARATDEEFEDGIQSELARQLTTIIERHGKEALLSIATILKKESDSTLEAQTLRILGRMRSHHTHNLRLWLIKRGLTSSSVLVRDAAGLGLSSLGDPSVISTLREAACREPYTELREDLERIISGLERTSRAVPPYHR